ncbi:MAG: LysM peptidoglycan-binding domain-containing protein [Planctomycetaceae bacterium]
MGILLIGVVAALFFRQDPVAVSEPISPHRRQQLNQRLRDREVALYIPEEEASAPEALPATSEPQWTLRTVLQELDQKNRTSPAPVHSQRSLEDHTSNRDSLDGYRTWKPGRGAVASASADLPVAARRLPPLHATDESLTFSSPAAKTVTAAGAGSENTPDDTAESATLAPPDGDFDEHTVQFGETLSSIAGRYLGSQSRYGLIFEANRDRLTSADRVQVGMKLRIPKRTAAAN